MCNCRLKYPRGMSIVTCIVLYISLIGLLVAYFQPYWLVMPKDSKFGCLNSDTDLVEKLVTTDSGACGFSGMCYPMEHGDKLETESCYPKMGEEKCVWYDSLEKMGNMVDQVCTLLFLVGLILCVIAWFYTIIGCCSLTCCCCNLYTAVASILTIGALAILVSVLLWLGMMGEYKLTDKSCLNVFCGEIGTFNFGSCSIGWSGYLGLVFWLAVVACTVVSWYNAYQYSHDIKEAITNERSNPNAAARKAGKVPVTEVFSHESAATVRSDRSRYLETGHGATNGFAVSNRQNREMAWEP